MSDFLSKKWVMWLSLFIFMPLGLFLLWMHRDDFKISTKVIVSVFFIFNAIISFTIFSMALLGTVVTTSQSNNVSESLTSDLLISSETSTSDDIPTIEDIDTTEDIPTIEDIDTTEDVPAVEDTDTEENIPAIDTTNATSGEKNALGKATSYLAFSSFSYSGLIEQLEFEGFSNDEAIYGVDNCGADWYEQALLKSNSYLNFSSFSYIGLVEQLEFDGFTNDEAIYGVDNCGADWNEQAVLKAESYLNFSQFSKQGLIEQLEFDGFTNEEATYGVEQAY